MADKRRFKSGPHRTHDYTNPVRCWGHDYIFRPKAGGIYASMLGWGSGIKRGDYLLLSNGDATTRYQVVTIEYKADPKDMWQADVLFAPREQGQES